MLTCFDTSDPYASTLHGVGELNSEGLPTLPNLSRVVCNKWESTKYLIQVGVLERPDCCKKCGKSVAFKKDPYMTDVLHKKGALKKGPSEYKECFIYRCKDRDCNWQVSVFNESFFGHGKKSPGEVLIVFYLWLAGATPKAIRAVSGWSEKATLEYFLKFRRLVSANMTDFIENVTSEEYFTYDEGQVGGPGIEVQIDESAFGKRKYHRGHHVETKWVFGGVEILPAANGRKKGGKFFAVVVPDRTRETLHGVIKKFIKPGTRIVSDGWSAYSTLGQLEDVLYEHEVVNHSKRFKNWDTGAHTNTIEGKWNKLKKSIPRQGFRQEKVLQEYLGEQMWRHTNRGHLWEASIVTFRDFFKREF